MTPEPQEQAGVCRGTDEAGRPRSVTTAPDVIEWLASRASEGRYGVHVVPISRLGGWVADPDSGDLVHDSGRFFRIQGLRVREPGSGAVLWEQPIVNQAEIGIVGFLLQERCGEPHVLAQAKMEPGNINLVQLSPTLQATRSNYSRVHGGAFPRHLDYFAGHPASHILVDELQSEQGSRFYRKRNRTMVVELATAAPVDSCEGFEWIPLAMLVELLGHDNVVNMNARSVLASLWAADAGHNCTRTDRPLGRFGSLVEASATAELDDGEHTIEQLGAWLAMRRNLCTSLVTLEPLRLLKDWIDDGVVIRHRSGHFFTVLGVDVAAGEREVAAWQQPLVASAEVGLNTLVCQVRGGLLHVLMRAQGEPGTYDRVELAPTVQCVPGEVGQDGSASLFRDRSIGVTAEHVRYDHLLSEEGGRFYQVQNRYRIIEIDESEQLDAPDEFRWLTVAQMREFIRRGGSVNVEARTLAACLLAASRGGDG